MFRKRAACTKSHLAEVGCRIEAENDEHHQCDRPKAQAAPSTLALLIVSGAALITENGSNGREMMR